MEQNKLKTGLVTKFLTLSSTCVAYIVGKDSCDLKDYLRYALILFTDNLALSVQRADREGGGGGGSPLEGDE